MATEPIISSSGIKTTTSSPASAKEGQRRKEAPPLESEPVKTGAKDVEPIDRVEVSTAARQMAKAVADDRPKLQLSPQQLRSITTGRV